MPPAVGRKPALACENFPICFNNRYQSRGAGRPRSEFCKPCLDTGRICAFQGCSNPCAPRRGRLPMPTTCMLHYERPSLADVRGWNNCKYAQAGCKELADQHNADKCCLRVL